MAKEEKLNRVQISHSTDETRRVAARFVQSLPAHAVVGLIGPLGSGKTTFIQGMATGCGIDPDGYVTSPTFALIHEYTGKGAASDAHTLVHFDLYRLNSFAELLDIGFEDYLAKSRHLVIEWADRFSELEGWLTHQVLFEIIDATTRKICIS